MAELVFDRLKRHPGIWRVDGVKQISNRGKLGAAASVQFSEVLEDHVNEVHKSSALTGHTRSLVFHAASLYELKAGSIWKDGALFRSPPPHEYPLEIDVSRCHFHRLGQLAKLDDKWATSIIPESEYSLASSREELSETWFAACPVVNDIHTQWLVVPCSEILRFYYGPSSRILSSVLRGTTEDYVDWSKSRYEHGAYILHAKQRLSRNESAVLTRALTSDSARRNLFGIHNYLAKLNADNQGIDASKPKPLTIRARFPFEDMTNLTVAGKRIRLIEPSSGNRHGVWGVFAQQILTCSHSFGFDTTPIIESDEPFVASGTNTTQDGGAPHHYPFLPEETEPDFPIVETPSNANLKKLALLDFTNQFTALNGLRFHHMRPQATEPTTKGHGIEVPIDGLSLGEKSHTEESNSVLGVGLFQHQVEQIDRDIMLFVAMLDRLQQIIGQSPLSWPLTTRTLEGRINAGKQFITTFPSNIARLRSWHKIEDVHGYIRPRQVVIAEIMPSKSKFFYMLEMELKPGESGQCTIILYSPTFRHIENKELAQLLRLSAIQNRWIEKSNKWKLDHDAENARDFFSKFAMHRINHPSKKSTNGHKTTPDPEQWAKQILERITEAFDLPPT